MDPKHTADTSASDIYATHTPTSATSADTAESTAPAATPDMHSVMEQLPMPRALKDWLVCLRKPAISLQYRVSKRHIPDLDSEPQAGAAASDESASASAPSSSSTDSAPAADPSAAKDSAASGSTEDTATPATPPAAAKGKNTDLMTLSGGLTIRYFDLGMGLVGLLLVGCLFRGGCRVRKMLK
jgi:hypothetical protein